MTCPKCKNKNFEKSSEFTKPVKQIKTEKYPHGTYRRYVCLQCSYKWVSIEKFDRVIEIKTRLPKRKKPDLGQYIG